MNMIFRGRGRGLKVAHHKRGRESQEQKQCARPRYKFASIPALAFDSWDSRLRTCIPDPLQLQANIMGSLPALIRVFGQTVLH